MKASAGQSSAETYSCPICKDTGSVYPVVDGRIDYSRVVRCSCRETPEAKLERSKWMMRYCRLPEGTEDKTLDTFSAYTPDLKKALKAAREFTPESLDKCLVFGGNVDRGKSHLLIGVCRHWLSLEVPARYVYVPHLLDELRAGQELEGSESFRSQMNIYQNVPLLALDDLAAQKPSAWTQEKLTTIVHMRGEKGLHTLVTLNVELDKIPGDDLGRLGSRLRRYAGENIHAIEDCGEYSLRGK